MWRYLLLLLLCCRMSTVQAADPVLPPDYDYQAGRTLLLNWMEREAPVLLRSQPWFKRQLEQLRATPERAPGGVKMSFFYSPSLWRFADFDDLNLTHPDGIIIDLIIDRGNYRRWQVRYVNLIPAGKKYHYSWLAKLSPGEGIDSKQQRILRILALPSSPFRFAPAITLWPLVGHDRTYSIVIHYAPNDIKPNVSLPVVNKVLENLLIREFAQ